MGGFSSKVGRTLPTKARASANGGLGSEFPSHPVSRSRPVAAKETKDNEIERDGKDPHLLANLGRIGQVNVDTQATAGASRKALDQVSEMYRTRDIAEQQATSSRPVQNRLLVESLSNLLDDRKTVTSRSELEQLAARYTVDTAVIGRLARFINTPSIGEGTVVQSTDDDGEEKITMQAVWTDPILKDT